MIRTRLSFPKLCVSRESLRLYSFNLSGTIPAIEPRIEVDVSFHDRPIKLDFVQPTIIQQRISRGDKIFVAYHQSTPVAYLFATTKHCWVEEIQNSFVVTQGEVYLYDTFTSVEYRRNRICSFLICNAVQFFKMQEFSYALIFSRASNIQSMSAIERVGFERYETIHFYNLLGVKMWNFLPRSNGVQSRFSNEI